MTRRKGERTARQNERDFSFIVELAMPPGGLGPKLDLIHQFHDEREIEIRRGLYHRRDDRDFVRWCFANRADAEALKGAFGGQLLSARFQ